MDFSSVSNGSEECDVQCHMDPTEVRKHHCERSYRPRSGESLATHTNEQEGEYDVVAIIRLITSSLR